MSNLQLISNELLTRANGGAQTWRELSQFATQRGFTVTSSTGGHHLGWAHRAGRAVDVRTRDHSTSDINAFMRDARGRVHRDVAVDGRDARIALAGALTVQPVHVRQFV
jgi:hypothetical protein